MTECTGQPERKTLVRESKRDTMPVDDVRSTGSGGSIGCGPVSHEGWKSLGVGRWKANRKGDTLQRERAAQPNEELSAHVSETSVNEEPPAPVEEKEDEEESGTFLEKEECKPDLQSKYRASEELSPEQEEERRELRQRQKRANFLKRRQEQESPGATTPEAGSHCRMCSHPRVRENSYCGKCGHQFVDGD